MTENNEKPTIPSVNELMDQLRELSAWNLFIHKDLVAANQKIAVLEKKLGI